MLVVYRLNQIIICISQMLIASSTMAATGPRISGYLQGALKGKRLKLRKVTCHLANQLLSTCTDKSV